MEFIYAFLFLVMFIIMFIADLIEATIEFIKPTGRPLWTRITGSPGRPRYEERPYSYWMSMVDGDLDGFPDEIEHWFD